NTLLLFYVLRRLTGMVWQSAVVAALFALHPLHVESVAWVAERKDVLSTLFWILTMLTYIRYVEKPEVRRYLVVTITFALGLMSKPMLVTLPLTLLLLDYWPLGRVETKIAASAGLSSVEQAGGGKQQKQRHRTSLLSLRNFLPLVKEKIPLFVLVVGSSVATFIAQKGGGAVARVSLFTIEERVTNALMSYVRYLGKMVWPTGLAVFYPYRTQWPAWQLLGAGLLLVAISYLAIRNLKRLPYLAVGWLWYIGTLVPVIGLVQVGSQSMADRYTYVPLLGIFIMLVWGISDLVSHWRPRKVAIPIATAGMLCVLVILTSIQVRTWRDTITLMRHA
ncbi:MAG: glycosyltransferase family 39 protein, partial [Bacteroidota bacterium]